MANADLPGMVSWWIKLPYRGVPMDQVDGDEEF